MSIAIIELDKKKIPALKSFARSQKLKIRIVKEENETEELMAKLIEEGLQSEDVSEEEMNNYFRKHGIEL